MSELLCNDCDSPALLKVSKAGKGYYNCPKCPSGNPDFPKKFLTFLGGEEEYKKKRSSPRQNCNPCDKIKEKLPTKRKAEKPLENPEEKRLKAFNDELEVQIQRNKVLMDKTDLLLEKVEKLLSSPASKTPESEDEVDDSTE